MNFEKQPPPPLDEVSQRILAQTPLHFACYIGDGHLLDSLIGRALLQNNNIGDALNINVCALISEEDSLNGWTPAHWAAFYGQLSCLMKLHVKPGLGFDTPSHRSNTSPLHMAAQSGAVLCLKWLLQCGSSQNRQDFLGETALHKAAKAGNTDCVAMLIGHGASLDMKNHRGLTPIEVAEQSNHTALAQYLRRATDQAEYGSTTKCCTPPLPISDLSGSVAEPKRVSQTYFYTAHPKFPGMSFLTKQEEDLLPAHIVMNGEDIHSFSPQSDDMEQEDSDMTENACCNNNNTHTQFLSQTSAGLKRSYDEYEEEYEHFHKRRCLVPSSRKSHEERYGDAYNNNVISSYNAVLAMRVEPISQTNYTDPMNTCMSSGKSDSPTLPQSSVMDHEASLAAQQGYDSTFMSTVSSAFH